MNNSTENEPRGAGEALLRWLGPPQGDDAAIEAIGHDRSRTSQYLSWALERSRIGGPGAAATQLALLQGAIEAAVVALTQTDEPALWERCAELFGPAKPLT